MKSALIIFFIGFFNVSYGQKTLDIEGLYNLPGSGDPQGGATLGVLKNNKFAVMAFGAAETGTWKMINDTLIEFNFKNSPSNLYTLYGRRDNNLADSSRIFFQEFETSGSFIHVGKSGPGKIRMKRIFNEEASCIEFPNVYTQKSEAGNISFAKQPYEDEQWNIYTFNNEEKCNDFVAIMNYKKDPIPPVYASIQKEGLYFLKEK